MRTATEKWSIFRRGWPADLAFWLAYTLFWHLIFSPSVTSLAGVLTSTIYTFWHAIASYVHLRFLFPLVRGQQRLISYIPGVILVAVTSSLALAASIYGYFRLIDADFAGAFFDRPQALVGPFLGSTILALAMTGGLYSYYSRRAFARRQAELERERITTELNYLRSQINPHFLFNALNSIYFLIKKDPERAAESLAGFSELLRYQLYRGKEDRILLRDELEQLRRYTELAQLRHGEELRIDWQWPERLNGECIPPLLLLPLVENACKHVRRRNGYIAGQARVIDDRLEFNLRNARETAETLDPERDADPDGGIGLTNIRRRLELLFPGDHHLTADPHGAEFRVQLNIPLL